MRLAWLVSVLVACGGAEPTAPTGDDDDGVQCEPPVYFDVVIEGRVTEAGVGAEGARVWLEERNWAPGTSHGETTSGANGTFTLSASALPIVEGCWGWATGFYVMAERGGLTDEWGANSVIVNAWLAGESTVRLDGIPIELE